MAASQAHQEDRKDERAEASSVSRETTTLPPAAVSLPGRETDGKAALVAVVASSFIVALLIAVGRPVLWDIAYEDVSENEPVTVVEDESGTSDDALDGAQDDSEQDNEFEFAQDVLGVYEVQAAVPDEVARSKNLQTAARALNGVIIGPGETLSFNQVIGEPIAERGYEDVAEVENAADALDQVATALHVAALKAGLSVPVRYAHVIAVDYVPLGLDAAVSWDMDDLVVRNDYRTAVSVQASASGSTVTVSIFGVSEDPTISHDVISTVVETYSLPAAEVYDDPLSQGLLSSSSVRFARSETHLETYRDGEFEQSQLLYADLYQLPVSPSE